MSWPHPESFMKFPDRKECHLFKISIPDLILRLILDLPKCAEQCSRCSFSLIFTFRSCLKNDTNMDLKMDPTEVQNLC